MVHGSDGIAFDEGGVAPLLRVVQACVRGFKWDDGFRCRCLRSRK